MFCLLYTSDLISSSGATAVFILESAVTKGLQFNSVWSVGNACLLYTSRCV